MKQKITISIPVKVDKCRAKAMQTAVSTTDVISVTIDQAKDQMVVIGEDIDSFELMKCLKKKFKCATILAIEEVKPPPPPPQKQPDKKDGEKKEDKKDTAKKDECCKPCPCPPGYNNPCVQYYPLCQPVYDPYPQTTCSIL